MPGFYQKVAADSRVCEQIKGPFIKAAVSVFRRLSTYAIVHQGFPRVFQLFNEPADKHMKTCKVQHFSRTFIKMLSFIRFRL